jgi:hypothetical protein
MDNPRLTAPVGQAVDRPTADASVFRDGGWYLRQSAKDVSIQQFACLMTNPFQRRICREDEVKIGATIGGRRGIAVDRGAPYTTVGTSLDG